MQTIEGNEIKSCIKYFEHKMRDFRKQEKRIKKMQEELDEIQKPQLTDYANKLIDRHEKNKTIKKYGFCLTDEAKRLLSKK